MSDYFPLLDLKIGAKAIVYKIKTEDDAVLRHLMAMGVVQGATVMLENRFPSYVIKIGRSRAALDFETAQTIYVTQNS
jgi:ferrous iron transport protein A